jgi:hypothetical protein
MSASRVSDSAITGAFHTHERHVIDPEVNPRDIEFVEQLPGAGAIAEVTHDRLLAGCDLVQAWRSAGF